MNDCVFCEILAGRMPSSEVYRDEITRVFLDINPLNPGHALVIPVEHAAGLADLEEETGMQLFKIAMKTAEALRRSGLRCEGVNLFLADGEAAFQDVFHVHLHVVPRFKGDNIRIEARRPSRPAREELDRIAAALQSVMNFG